MHVLFSVEANVL